MSVNNMSYLQNQGLNVRFNHVSKIYNENPPVTAVNDVTVELPEKSFTALTGPSGSGKSSLLNLFGLIDRPTSGEVIFNQVDTSDLTTYEQSIIRNQSIGFVFQSHFLLPEFTVEENILMPYWISKREITDEVLHWAVELMEITSIIDLQSKYPTTLSGGQAQRVAIARALMNRPSILLADEPFGSLDSNLTNDLFKIFVELSEFYGFTTLIITHNQSLLPLFPRVLHMLDGKLVRDQRNN